MRIGYGFGLAALAGGLTLGAPACALPANPGFHTGSNHAAQGYLGIDVRDVSEENIGSLHLHEARGAEIIRVDHDGPAGKMGLREHDVVLQMNGILVEGEELMRRMLHETAPGKTVTLVISRDGQQMTMTAQMADRSQVEKEAFEQHLATPEPQAPDSALPSGDSALATGGGNAAPAPTSRYSKSFLGTLLMSPSYTGAMLEVMSPQLGDFFGVPGGAGLLVRSVAPNSPAAMAGMRAGDIIVKANLQPVGSPSKWSKTIREAKGRPVSVIVMRDHQEKALTLLPDSKKHAGLDTPAPPYEPVLMIYLLAGNALLTEL